MRQLLTRTALIVILAGTAQVQAQDFRPVIYVNNSAITNYELDQRIRFLQILQAPEQGREAAEKALIEDRLRMQAARQLGIEVSDEGLESGLAEFAGRANMDVAQFTEVLSRNGISSQSYRDFIKAGIAWRGVVRQRILPRVQVTDAEIDRALKREIDRPIVNQLLISELIVPAPEGQEDQVMARIEELRASIRSEADFAAAARRFSATPSAQQGGRMDWVPVNRLPPSLRPILLSLQPGQMTQPLTVPGAVVLFYMRDTRGSLRPGATSEVIDYMRVILPDTASAARMAALAQSCDDLFVQANGLPQQQVQRQTVTQDAIPTDISLRLAHLDANETALIDRGGSADLVMLCTRTPALISGLEAGPVATATESDEGTQPADPNALPDRETVRQVVFNNKINAAADAYLAELRADAIIRR